LFYVAEKKGKAKKGKGEKEQSTSPVASADKAEKRKFFLVISPLTLRLSVEEY